MCVYVCLVCVFLTSDSSKTIDAIVIKLGTVTASEMVMHRVLIILTLTFMHGHTGLNHANNKCSIFSETVEVILIRFVVKIV